MAARKHDILFLLKNFSHLALKLFLLARYSISLHNLNDISLNNRHPFKALVIMNLDNPKIQTLHKLTYLMTHSAFSASFCIFNIYSAQMQL